MNKKLRTALRTGRDRIAYRLSRRFVRVALVDERDLDTNGKLLLHSVRIRHAAAEREARAAEAHKLDFERAIRDLA